MAIKRKTNWTEIYHYTGIRIKLFISVEICHSYNKDYLYTTKLVAILFNGSLPILKKLQIYTTILVLFLSDIFVWKRKWDTIILKNTSIMVAKQMSLKKDSQI